MSNRPMDFLDHSKGKRIIVKLKNGRQASGTLVAFDMHLNMWLDDADVSEDDKLTKYGRIFLRGDSVIFASPEE